MGKLKVQISFCDDKEKEKHLCLKVVVPNSWLEGPISRLIECFVDAYNNRRPDNKLNPDVVELSNSGGQIFIKEGAIEDYLAHKDVLLLRHQTDEDVNNLNQLIPYQDASSILKVDIAKIGFHGKGSYVAPTIHSEVNIDDIEMSQSAEKRLYDQYKTLKFLHGYKHPKTLAAAFKLISVLTGFYRLDRVDKYVHEILPTCKEVGGDWYIKAIQAKSFCRFKQQKFKEALDIFLEMEELIPASSKLQENIGHTYNSLGNYEKAEQYFQESLKSMINEEEKNPAEKGHQGGVLLGLGIVKDRLQKHLEAQPILLKSLEWYKDEAERGGQNSLVAKAHMSVGHNYEYLKKYQDAVGHYYDAVELFVRTCGEDSPLTANARHSLGKTYKTLRRWSECQKTMKEAFRYEVGFDSLRIMNLFEQLLAIQECHTVHSEELDDLDVAAYVPMVRQMVANFKRQRILEDGNIGAVYKAAGEVMATICDEYNEAYALMQRAIEIFKTVTEIDVSQLLSKCNQTLTLIRTLQRKQTVQPRATDSPSQSSNGDDASS